jgi:hypothetical protein
LIYDYAGIFPDLSDLVRSDNFVEHSA